MSIGDSNPKSNAILYLKGNGTQGLIIPIVSSLGNFGESGMVVYNSADKKVYYHDGTNWSAIGGTTSDGLIGNEVSQVGTNGGLVLSGNGTTASPLTISLVSGTTDGQTLRWNNTSGKWEVSNAATGLSTILTSARIYVGDASNTATAVAVSGDATLSNTGALTIANNAVNSNKIADGTIVNADISTTAAIAPSKIAQAAATSGDVLKWNGSAWAPAADAGGISNALTSGQVIIGNASNVATGVPISGDATLSNAGVLTLATGSVNSTKIADGTITNADISTTAAIATSKLGQSAATTGDVLKWNGTAWAPAADAQGISTTLTSGQILVGNSSNVATGVAMSGDATMTSTGAVTLSTGSVNSTKILDGTVSSADIADGTIANTDVATAAGIAGTKINPDFGTQNVTTTGTTTTGGLTASGTVAFNALTGTGTRMVVANDAGTLGTQSIPVSFTTANIIPRGDGTGLVGSAIYDDGSSLGFNTISPLHRFTFFGQSGNSSTGPQMSFVTSSDTYPLIHFMPYAHNDLAILFDSYLAPNGSSGVWTSSSASSNFKIHKYGSLLGFYYASGVTPGGSVGWSSAMQILANGNITNDNFTKLGSNAPAIKTATLTTTMNATSGGAVTVTLTGVVADKILSVAAHCEYSPDAYVPDNYTRNPGYEFNYFYITSGANSNITVWGISGNDTYLVGKPVKLFITYEQ